MSHQKSLSLEAPIDPAMDDAYWITPHLRDTLQAHTSFCTTNKARLVMGVNGCEPLPYIDYHELHNLLKLVRPGMGSPVLSAAAPKPPTAPVGDAAAKAQSSQGGHNPSKGKQAASALPNAQQSKHVDPKEQETWRYFIQARVYFHELVDKVRQRYAGATDSRAWLVTLSIEAQELHKLDRALYKERLWAEIAATSAGPHASQDMFPEDTSPPQLPQYDKQSHRLIFERVQPRNAKDAAATFAAIQSHPVPKPNSTAIVPQTDAERHRDRRWESVHHQWTLAKSSLAADMAVLGTAMKNRDVGAKNLSNMKMHFVQNVIPGLLHELREMMNGDPLHSLGAQQIGPLRIPNPCPLPATKASGRPPNHHGVQPAGSKKDPLSRPAPVPKISGSYKSVNFDEIKTKAQQTLRKRQQAATKAMAPPPRPTVRKTSHTESNKIRLTKTLHTAHERAQWRLKLAEALKHRAQAANVALAANSSVRDFIANPAWNGPSTQKPGHVEGTNAQENQPANAYASYLKTLETMIAHEGQPTNPYTPSLGINARATKGPSINVQKSQPTNPDGPSSSKVHGTKGSLQEKSRPTNVQQGSLTDPTTPSLNNVQRENGSSTSVQKGQPPIPYAPSSSNVLGTKESSLENFRWGNVQQGSPTNPNTPSVKNVQWANGSSTSVQKDQPTNPYAPSSSNILGTKESSQGTYGINSQKPQPTNPYTPSLSNFQSTKESSQPSLNWTNAQKAQPASPYAPSVGNVQLTKGSSQESLGWINAQKAQSANVYAPSVGNVQLTKGSSRSLGDVSKDIKDNTQGTKATSGDPSKASKASKANKANKASKASVRGTNTLPQDKANGQRFHPYSQASRNAHGSQTSFPEATMVHGGPVPADMILKSQRDVPYPSSPRKADGSETSAPQATMVPGGPSPPAKFLNSQPNVPYPQTSTVGHGSMSVPQSVVNAQGVAAFQLPLQRGQSSNPLLQAPVPTKGRAPKATSQFSNNARGKSVSSTPAPMSQPIGPSAQNTHIRNSVSSTPLMASQPVGMNAYNMNNAYSFHPSSQGVASTNVQGLMAYPQNRTKVGGKSASSTPVMKNQPIGPNAHNSHNPNTASSTPVMASQSVSMNAHNMSNSYSVRPYPPAVASTNVQGLMAYPQKRTKVGGKSASSTRISKNQPVGPSAQKNHGRISASTTPNPMSQSIGMNAHNMGNSYSTKSYAQMPAISQSFGYQGQQMGSGNGGNYNSASMPGSASQPVDLTANDISNTNLSNLYSQLPPGIQGYGQGYQSQAMPANGQSFQGSVQNSPNIHGNRASSTPVPTSQPVGQGAFDLNKPYSMNAYTQISASGPGNGYSPMPVPTSQTFGQGAFDLNNPYSMNAFAQMPASSAGYGYPSAPTPTAQPVSTSGPSMTNAYWTNASAQMQANGQGYGYQGQATGSAQRPNPYYHMMHGVEAIGNSTQNASNAQGTKRKADEIGPVQQGAKKAKR